MKPLLLFIFFISTQTLAQTTYTVSGYVTDAESGERLIGASVYLPDLNKGTSTNQYGFYSLTVATDTVTLLFSYVGYASEKQVVPLQQNLRLDVELSADNLLEEVEVVASPEDNAVEQVQMGMHKIPMQTIRKAPVLGGEADILKTVSFRRKLVHISCEKAFELLFSSGL